MAKTRRTVLMKFVGDLIFLCCNRWLTARQEPAVFHFYT